MDLSTQDGMGGGRHCVQEMKEKATRRSGNCSRVWRQRERGEAELEMAEEDDEGAVFESDADGQDQD